jgi:hypothetical protein
MLDRATIVASALAHRSEPLVFNEARWAQVTFEVARDSAMARLPADMTRPIPCYARFIAVEGVVKGAQTKLAVLMVGGRFRMMPRNLVVSAVAAGSAMEGVLTSGLEPGEVSLVRSGSDAEGTVAIDGVTLARVQLPGIYAIEPSMLRWDPWLCIAEEEGRSVLTEITLTPTARAAFLSKGATVTPEPGLPRMHTWRQLRSLLTVSACYAEGTLTLGVPQVIQECS